MTDKEITIEGQLTQDVEFQITCDDAVTAVKEYDILKKGIKNGS